MLICTARDSGAPGELKERGDGTPVPLAAGHQVEVRRAPVLDERRARVPAQSPIELLDVRFAPPARGDEVAFLPLLRLEANEVLRRLRAAARAAESRQTPA